MTARLAPAGLDRALRTSHAVEPLVDSWRGGELLGGRLPIIGGELVETADSAVPDRLTITVPAYDPTTSTSYVPTAATTTTAPLGQYGQQLAVGRRIKRLGQAQSITVQLGWFRVDEWERDGDELRVDCSGLLAILDTAKLLGPTAPPTGATFVSEAKRLVEGLLPLDLSAAPVDRAVPRGFAWERERLGSLQELVAAWPARMYVDEDGTLNIAAPFADATDPADVQLVEGSAVTVDGEQLATVVELGDGGTRDGIANAVVARGEQTDDPARAPVQAIAYDTDPSSPTAWGTDYGRAPAFFSSPLLTTVAQARAAATTRLANLKRAARTLSVTAVPDPRISAAQGTRVDLTRADGAVVRTRAVRVNLPLTALGGAARYELAVL